MFKRKDWLYRQGNGAASSSSSEDGGSSASEAAGSSAGSGEVEEPVQTGDADSSSEEQGSDASSDDDVAAEVQTQQRAAAAKSDSRAPDAEEPDEQLQEPAPLLKATSQSIKRHRTQSKASAADSTELVACHAQRDSSIIRAESQDFGDLQQQQEAWLTAPKGARVKGPALRCLLCHGALLLNSGTCLLVG